VDDLIFSPHLLVGMADHQIPAEAVYHVVAGADEKVVQPNGRTRYTGTWESRVIVVVVEGDERAVVTEWERTRESRRNRRRRR